MPKLKAAEEEKFASARVILKAPLIPAVNSIFSPGPRAASRMNSQSGGFSSGAPVATKGLSASVLKCTNGQRTGRGGPLQPALMEIDGLFIRGELRRPIALVLHLAASRHLGLPPQARPPGALDGKGLRAHAVLSSEPAGVNRQDNTLRCSYPGGGEGDEMRRLVGAL